MVNIVGNLIVNNIPVENRLELINEVYKGRREDRVNDEILKQTQQIKSPLINLNSKKLIQNKNRGIPQKRVDQRLYEDHMKRKISQNVKQKLADRNTQVMAQPKTTVYHPTTTYDSAQTSISGNKKEVVNRLMDYQHKYNTQEKYLQEKYEDQECTFKPQINTNSRVLSNQMVYGMPFEFRNSNGVNKYNNRMKKEVNDRN